MSRGVQRTLRLRVTALPHEAAGPDEIQFDEPRGIAVDAIIERPPRGVIRATQITRACAFPDSDDRGAAVGRLRHAGILYPCQPSGMHVTRENCEFR